MSYLFEIKGYNVVPREEILLIEPFRSIWNSYKNKDLALKVFAYIEFMSSPYKSNPFRNYPEDEKHDKIVRKIFGNSKWKPNNKVKKAIKDLHQMYLDMNSSYRYYITAKKSIEKTLKFLESIDYYKINPKTGLPIYKPKDITAALKDLRQVKADMDALEKKMFEEFEEDMKVRSGKKISPFSIPK